jgi:polyferredoxin
MRNRNSILLLLLLSFFLSFFLSGSLLGVDIKLLLLLLLLRVFWGWWCETNFGTLFTCHRGAAEVIRSQEEEECDGFLPCQILQDISAELMKEMKQTEPAAAAGFDTWWWVVMKDCELGFFSWDQS